MTPNQKVLAHCLKLELDYLKKAHDSLSRGRDVKSVDKDAKELRKHVGSSPGTLRGVLRNRHQLLWEMRDLLKAIESCKLESVRSKALKRLGKLIERLKAEHKEVYDWTGDEDDIMTFARRAAKNAMTSVKSTSKVLEECN